MYFFEPDSAAVAAEIGIRASLCNSVLALGDDYDFEQDRAVIETRALIPGLASCRKRAHSCRRR